MVRVPGRDRRTGPGRPTRTPRAALTRISESCRLDGSLMAARNRSCALRLAVLLPQCYGVRRVAGHADSEGRTGSLVTRDFESRHVLIVLICCLLIARLGYVRPLLLEPAQLAKARPAQDVTALAHCQCLICSKFDIFWSPTRNPSPVHRSHTFSWQARRLPARYA